MVQPAPKGLGGFDSLPDSAFVRQTLVARLYDVSPVTVARWAKAGHLPAARQIGGTFLFNVGELRASMRSQSVVDVPA